MDIDEDIICDQRDYKLNFTIPKDCMVMGKRNMNNGNLQPHIRISHRECYVIFHVYVQIRNMDENYHFKTPVSSLTIPKPKKRKIEMEKNENDTDIFMESEKEEKSNEYQMIGLDILRSTKKWKKSTIQHRKYHTILQKIFLCINFLHKQPSKFG